MNDVPQRWISGSDVKSEEKRMLKIKKRKKMHPAISKAYRNFLGGLPQNRMFDYLVSLLIFMRSHRRLPKVQGGLFNDSLFYLKTTDEILDPLRVYISDKEYVKTYIKEKVGDAYNVPTLDVVNTLKEALAYDFPAHCVIKPTHMSGPVMFRRDGSEIDYEVIRKWFASNYYLSGREANYKHLKPKLIIEPYIFGKAGVEDYKFFCVNGKPCVVQVDGSRHIHHTRNFYTTDWQELPFSAMFPKGPTIRRPDNLEKMLEMAAILSKDFNIIRVDLYSDDKSILVGELTNCPGNATMRFVPKEGEVKMTRLMFGDTEFERHWRLPKSRPIMGYQNHAPSSSR
jgi:hypothetical protein